jgi:Na+/melibiose symporter-like transporter
MKAARLGSQQLFTYALPALPLAVPTVGLYVLLPTWYVEQGGLALWLVGLILMLARVSDLITDPLIGYWLDRGSPVRYRQFILAGAACAAACRPCSAFSAAGINTALSGLDSGAGALLELAGGS